MSDLVDARYFSNVGVAKLFGGSKNGFLCLVLISHRSSKSLCSETGDGLIGFSDGVDPDSIERENNASALYVDNKKICHLGVLVCSRLSMGKQNNI